MTDQPTGFTKLVEMDPDETSTSRMRKWRRLLQKAHAANSDKYPPKDEPEPKCSECKDVGYLLLRNDQGDAWAEPCRCKETAEQYRTRVLLGQSGLNEDEYRTKRFTTFNLDKHADCPAMLDAAKQWLAGRLPWLVFIGRNGIGKSHLAVAATGALIEAGKMVRYIPWYELTATLRMAQKASGDAGYDLELKEISDAPWLVIDDISEEEFRTDFQKAALTALVDRRYRNRFPTLFATNLTMQEITARTNRVADRLRDGSLCHLFRAKHAVSVRPTLKPEGE